MRIWLLQRSEPTPHDNAGRQRLMRMGLVAQLLADKGSEVVWWTSTFDHYNRRQRYPASELVDVSEGYQVQYLRGTGYKNNISVARLHENRVVAREFRFVAERSPKKPDVIMASIPTVELAAEAVAYGRRHAVPVVLDIRDLWPDVFVDPVPSVLKPMARLVIFPMRRQLARVCREATAITGITEEFVQWAVRHAGRNRTSADVVFPMAYFRKQMPEDVLDRARGTWNDLKIFDDPDALVVAFFGTFGRGFDIDTVVSAARRLAKNGTKIKFVLCGDGEHAERLVGSAQGLDNVVFPGWVDESHIRTLLEHADIGLAPYVPTVNFLNNVPNKPAEYLSGSLPIASSLDSGPLHRIIVENDCGFSYGGDPEALAQALTELAHDRSRLSEMKSNASRTFEELFDGTLVYARLFGYLKEISGAH